MRGLVHWVLHSEIDKKMKDYTAQDFRCFFNEVLCKSQHQCRENGASIFAAAAQKIETAIATTTCTVYFSPSSPWRQVDCCGDPLLVVVVERGPAAPVRVGGGLEGHESARPAATLGEAEAGHFLQVRDGVRDGRAVLLAEVALDDVGDGAIAPHVAGLVFEQ